MAAKSTRDLVRNLQLAAAGQADLVVKPAGATPEPAPPAPEPAKAPAESAKPAPAPVAPPPAAAIAGPAAESDRPATQRVRGMSLPELKQAYGVQVPDDESICQYTIRVPKWLRHVIAQQCMLRGLSSQEFGMLAVQMLLEEMAETEEH